MAGSSEDLTPDDPPLSDADDSPVLYSLQHALQDFAIVFIGATIAFLALVLTGLSDWLLRWTDAYPRLQLTAMFLYAILLAVGFGTSILHRWMQLTEVAHEQQKTRRELERKASELTDRNRELERFSYAASHDLREPLRMINTYLGLLEREVDPTVLDEESREYLDEARNASRRMENLVRGILQYAQMSPNADTSQRTDADAALDAALENLAHRISARDVEIDRSPLPPVMARRDELLVVFQNLLQNSLAHGGPDLDRVIVDGTRQGESVRIRVIDDGWGIDPANQDRVFEMFRQGNGSSPSAGAGMGLPMCERIIERHDGEINVESSRGHGAEFEITLPAAEPESPEAEGSKRAGAKRSPTGSQADPEPGTTSEPAGTGPEDAAVEDRSGVGPERGTA